MKKLVTVELNNKLFIRGNLNNKFEIIYNKNFRIDSIKDFKIIKNLIEIELFSGQRPKMIVSSIKKGLVINLRVTKNSLTNENWLQKSPVIWKKYLSKFSYFDHYSIPPFLSEKAKITVAFKKLSKYDNWLKSAYLD